MQFNTTCTCKACKNISGLDLKIFVHLTPTETGTLFANYVRYPESGPAEETKELMQNVWDMAFPNLKPFIEQGYAKSTQGEQ